MDKLKLAINRLLLVCSFAFLMCSVVVVIIDAARSIGASVIELASLQDLLFDLGANAAFVDSEAQGFVQSLIAQFMNLSAAIVLMILAMVLYLMSYLFKKA